MAKGVRAVCRLPQPCQPSGTATTPTDKRPASDRVSAGLTQNLHSYEKELIETALAESKGKVAGRMVRPPGSEFPRLRYI